jgi:hypothetical protein
VSFQKQTPLGSSRCDRPPAPVLTPPCCCCLSCPAALPLLHIVVPFLLPIALFPPKQRRSYFDSADYFLEAQAPPMADSPLPQCVVSSSSSGSATPAPGTPLQQVLPMKLQPCKHVSQPSRLRVSS